MMKQNRFVSNLLLFGFISYEIEWLIKRNIVLIC
jgi:hypothetical protein